MTDFSKKKKYRKGKLMRLTTLRGWVGMGWEGYKYFSQHNFWTRIDFWNHDKALCTQKIIITATTETIIKDGENS